MQHQQYFLMLERAPGYFLVDFFVRESKRFMVCRTKLDFILPVVLLSWTTGYLFNFPAFYAWGENLVTYKGRACKLY